MDPRGSIQPRRLALAFGLGCSALFVFFGAAEAFEVRGQNSLQEIVAGCVFGSAYLAFCQFWLTSAGGRGGRQWPTFAALLAPLVFELPFLDRGAVLPFGLPQLAAGWFGCGVGAVIAARWARGPSAGAADPAGGRRRLRWAAAALGGGTLLVAAGVIPPLLADHTAGFHARSVAVALGGAAALNLLAAGLVAVGARRTAPAGAGLSAPGVLSILLAMLYAFASGIRTQNPALRTAAVLLVVCAAASLTATVLITATALQARRTGPPPAD